MFVDIFLEASFKLNKKRKGTSMNMVINPNKLKNKVVAPKKIISNFGGIKITSDGLVFVSDIDLLDLIEEEEFNNSIKEKTIFYFAS